MALKLKTTYLKLHFAPNYMPSWPLFLSYDHISMHIKTTIVKVRLPLTHADSVLFVS